MKSTIKDSLIHKITNRDCKGSWWEIDERATLEEVRQQVPNFFKTKFGRNERYRMYRGFLIVTMTVQFSGCSPERKVVAYAYYRRSGENAPDTFSVSTGTKIHDVRQAKKLVDHILKTGLYYYGVDWREEKP